MLDDEDEFGDEHSIQAATELLCHLRNIVNLWWFQRDELTRTASLRTRTDWLKRLFLQNGGTIDRSLRLLGHPDRRT